MLEVKNITYQVNENGKQRIILDNVSCKFEKGKLTAITGQNGSGKSTFLKIIMGILKPTKGEILYKGKNITNLSIEKRAKLGFNYAFQQPVVFKGITVKELIDIATGKNNKISDACECLSKVGLCAKNYLDREFDESLSGGEQKRIELALSLAKKGDCYFYDEPEAGIDLWSFEKLNSIFEKDKTYLVVSHQEKLLSKADNILVLKNGKIEQYDKAKKVLKNLSPSSCSKIIGGNNGNR